MKVPEDGMIEIKDMLRILQIVIHTLNNILVQRLILRHQQIYTIEFHRIRQGKKNIL